MTSVNSTQAAVNHPAVAQLASAAESSPARVPEIKSFEDFEAHYGSEDAEDALMQICEATMSSKSTTVQLEQVDTHNACNHTLVGKLTWKERVFDFVVHNGDRAGTEVESFADEGLGRDYEQEPPLQYTFVPRNPNLQTERPGMWAVYQAWTKEEWFKKKARSYNYDKFFSPGLKTERHYSEWAASKGLRIAAVES